MSVKTEETTYFYGELVRLRLHPEAFGQVVGEEDWGRRYMVRVHGEYEPRLFDDCELLPVVPEAAAGTGGHDDEPPKSNVIYPHFGANTETKGAA